MTISLGTLHCFSCELSIYVTIYWLIPALIYGCVNLWLNINQDSFASIIVKQRNNYGGIHDLNKAGRNYRY